MPYIRGLTENMHLHFESFLHKLVGKLWHGCVTSICWKGGIPPRQHRSCWVQYHDIENIFEKSSLPKVGDAIGSTPAWHALGDGSEYLIACVILIWVDFFIKAKLLIRSLSNSVELWIVVCPCVDSFFMVKALRVHRVKTCQMLPFQVSDFFPTLISFCVKDFKQKIGAVNPVDCCWVDFFMMFLHAGSS